MKREKIRRWQRFSTLIIVLIVFILLWPFLRMKGIKEFWHSTRFAIPNYPKINQPDAKELPKTFVVRIKSNNSELLAKLQQEGWPAYMKKDQIFIGPYLQSFQSQVNLDKISQLTGMPARME